VLHVDGDFADSSLPLEPRAGQLGERMRLPAGPPEARQDNCRRCDPSLTAGEQQFRIWIAPLGQNTTEVMLAEGPTNRPDAKMADARLAAYE